ncbi:MAG TPA: SCP2 sterol-binding domain-containing protein [Thermoleophilaceae bacterium]|nr:SCP2 sterol-binding domain-containing protein [Thermoleophilaceae bacterium]
MADQRDALRRMTAEDPELAARLVLMTLPAAAARIPGTLAYGLEVEGLGAWRVSVSGGRARVDPADGRDGTDFQVRADPGAFAALAAGTVGPLRLMMQRRLHVDGRRRRALRLRAMSSGQVGLDEVVAAGGRIDPDLMYRALPYLVEPDWTRGHRFTIRYELQGEGGGAWNVHVRDGERLAVDSEPATGELTATVRVTVDAYERMATGALTPSEAMQQQLTDVDGEIYPVTLLGRWIDRAAGRDDAELSREERQRMVQTAREGLWGANGAGPSQGDPGHDSQAADGQELLDYRQLYALWERQNWRAHELDFSVDREHWLATPRAAQENTIWSLGSFYVGEERVTADLAPFLLAAPSGEIELFLATQLVDEARHAAFFDRFGAEVMVLSADDLRGRMREVERTLLSPWREVFDDGLRDVAERIKRSPDDLELFVEGIATYHMVVEGFLAVTGQTLIRDYMLDHGLYPGFCEGFGLVERDEHRHVAFGVRFLRDAIEENPAFRSTVERVVLTLAPRAAYVFVPPYVQDPTEFVSYGYHSRQIYGFAYRTLKRRMKVLGIEIPPASELMPGPIGEPAAPVSAGHTNGGGPAVPQPDAA